MSDTKTDIEITSKAFPTSADMARWNALSPADQRTFIEDSEEAGFQSGLAPSETLMERITRVRAKV